MFFKRSGWLHLVTVVVLVFALVASPGCRRGDPGTNPAGSGGATDGGSPAGPPGSLLWVWPPDPETPEQAVSSSMALFRFEAAPEPSTLKAEVTPVPYYGFRLVAAGQIVAVVCEGLHSPDPHRVALFDTQTGAELAATYIASPRGWPNDRPSIIAREGPEPELPLADGEAAVVSFGSVVIDVRVPGKVAADALHAAVVIEPTPTTVTYHSGGGTVSQLEIRFDGVTARAGEPLPIPAEVLASGQAPTGFALEMKVALDLGKLPVSAGAGVAGEDGLYNVSVVRRPAPEFSVETRENLTGPMTMMPDSKEVLPYPGYRDQWSVRPGPHTFWISFTKPMDQPSVERALVEPSVLQGTWSTPIAWTFDWLSDRSLRVTVEPSSPLDAPIVSRINPVGASDTEGGRVWFTEPLLLFWAQASEVVGVAATTSGAPGQVLLPADGHPTGASVVGVRSVTDPEPTSTDRIYLALEPCREQEGDGPVRRLVWLGLSGITLDWVDLSRLVEPCWSAELIGGGRVFVDRHWSWETFSAESVEQTGQTTKVSVDRKAYRWLGFHPSPDGERVAAFRSATGDAGSVHPVDLVIFDLAGRELASVPGVTRIDQNDFYLWTIPAAWLPDDSGIVFIDRPGDGDAAGGAGGDGGPAEPFGRSRLAWVNLSEQAGTGATVIPDSAGSSREAGGAFVVWAGPPGETASGAGTSQAPVVYVGSVYWEPEDSQGYYRIVELTPAGVSSRPPSGLVDSPRT